MSVSESTKGSRAWDPLRTYDASPEQRKAIQERLQIKAALKKEWQTKVSNPYRGPKGYIFDPQVQRFLTMRHDHWAHFKPTPSTGLFGFVFGLGPLLGYWWYLTRERNQFEAKMRGGELAYADRTFKMA